MAHALTWNWRIRTPIESRVRAVLLSLLLHFLFFAGIEAGYRFDLWKYSPVAKLIQWLQPKPNSPAPNAQAKAAPPRPQREPQEVPVVFVDVDPAQAAEPPPSTPYYSAVGSRAANPDPSRDTGRPQLEGTQNLVLKTMDSDRAKPAETPAPAPVVAQPMAPGEEIPPTRPKEATALGPPPPAEPPPEAEERPETQPGDLAMAKPGPEVIRPTPQVTAPNVPDLVERPKPRPRTVAAARAQTDQNPSSALVGEKMMQPGGVKRFHVESSLDVRPSPLGNYDARFVAAVQQCWFALLEERRYSLDRLGKVVLDFRLTIDGRITDMRVAESNVGDIYTTICMLAITKPSPYERWPSDVRRMVGEDHRDVRFTFYY